MSNRLRAPRWPARVLAALALAAPVVAFAQSDDWYAAWIAAMRQKDTAQAATLARDAAGRGDPRGQYAYAVMLTGGIGVPRDTAEARRLMGEAAAAADAGARNEYGKMLMRGVGGPVDLDRAYESLSAASEQGHAEAMYHLSTLLSVQTFARADAVAAFAAAHRSALAGFAPAFGRVGLLMLQGQGVGRDAERAVEWFRQGAGKGDAQATAYLGWAMASGTGTTRDGPAGERLLTAAANTGNLWAMASLADAYRQGVVLSRDYVRAYTWATIALGRGHPSQQLRTARDELEKLLTPEQVTGAQRAARDWTPKALQIALPGDSAATPGRPASNGTAFFVSADGHALTNQHVIRGCKRLGTIEYGDATVVYQDEAADIAIVRTAKPAPSWARFRSDPPRLGETVYAFGFPLYGRLATAGNFTAGVVSSLAGPGNNAARIQITAQIQPGNSGGPVLDEKGRVIGVTVATLKASAAGGSVAPQNVNFAVNGAVVQARLVSSGVTPGIADDERTLRPDEVAEIARRYSTVLQCYR